jgi:hypothetical protein
MNCAVLPAAGDFYIDEVVETHITGSEVTAG